MAHQSKIVESVPFSDFISFSYRSYFRCIIQNSANAAISKANRRLPRDPSAHVQNFILENFISKISWPKKKRNWENLSGCQTMKTDDFRFSTRFRFFLKNFSKTENLKILKNLNRGKKLSNGTKIFKSINPIKNHKRFIQFEIMLFSITLGNFMFLGEKCNFAAKTTDFELNLGILVIYRNSRK